MMVAVFGGTTEGRRLATALSKNGIDVTLCVATDYGKTVVPSSNRLKVLVKRLDRWQMIDFFNESKIEYVIDATHPYAELVTENLKAACEETRMKYKRLVRKKSEMGNSVIYADNGEAAASILKNTDGNVLLTIGSKELEAFTAIKAYKDRLFIRMIPMMESLQKALSLGFGNRNIICMQGPFTTEMNVAILKMINATYLVTKDSGDVGGFGEKLAAAEQAGCKTIVIARPTMEEGYTLDELLQFFNIKEVEQFMYFPLFVNMSGRKVTVIGGGKVAERRIKTLLYYNADIKVISPKITPYLQTVAQNGLVKHIERKYAHNDVEGSFLVITATDSRETNIAVMEEANSLNIMAIISDDRTRCDCYFPSIVEDSNYIAGIVSKNGNHTGLKEMSERIRWFLNHE